MKPNSAYDAPTTVVTQVGPRLAVGGKPIPSTTTTSTMTHNTTAWPRAKRKPATMSPRVRRSAAPATCGRAPVRYDIGSSSSNAVAWPAELSAYAPPVPSASITSPTPKMPSGRVSCIPAELSAIPCDVRRGPRISGTIACRVGKSIAAGAALRKASRKISAKPSVSPGATRISSATVSAIRNPNPCAASSSRRRSKRSASAPATRLKTSAPSPRRLPRTPIRMIRVSSSALS